MSNRRSLILLATTCVASAASLTAASLRGDAEHAHLTVITGETEQRKKAGIDTNTIFIGLAVLFTVLGVCYYFLGRDNSGKEKETEAKKVAEEKEAKKAAEEREKNQLEEKAKKDEEERKRKAEEVNEKTPEVAVAETAAADRQEETQIDSDPEEELYVQRSKLYRFRDGDWEDRGLGDAKLLKHKVTGKVRFIMCQEETEKIVANHYVIQYPPYCDLQPNAGSDKCWVWSAQDCADGEMEVEKVALKFGNPDLANKFKEAFTNAKELNAKAETHKEV